MSLESCGLQRRRRRSLAGLYPLRTWGLRLLLGCETPQPSALMSSSTGRSRRCTPQVGTGLQPLDKRGHGCSWNGQREGCRWRIPATPTKCPNYPELSARARVAATRAVPSAGQAVPLPPLPCRPPPPESCSEIAAPGACPKRLRGPSCHRRQLKGKFHSGSGHERVALHRTSHRCRRS